MKYKDVENVLMITDLVARFGIPMIEGVISTIRSNSPTIKDIYKLRKSIKNPESYFENDGTLKPLTIIEDFDEDNTNSD